MVDVVVVAWRGGVVVVWVDGWGELGRVVLGWVVLGWVGLGLG